MPPLAVLLTPGQWGDARRMIHDLDQRTAPDAARPRQWRQSMPFRAVPAPNEVERTINRLKNSPAAAARYDKRADVFHRTATAAATRSRHPDDPPKSA